MWEKYLVVFPFTVGPFHCDQMEVQSQRSAQKPSKANCFASCLQLQVTAVALIVTILAYTAGPFTSAFFNPALASSVTFHCSGNTLLDYMQVYCLGPLTGMIVAVLLYQGNIPRFFQRNLFYYQKSKYRVPKGKPASTSTGTQKQEKSTKKGKTELSQKME
ncbi:aquaporin-12-like isoform 1-T1 [Sarcophilus harrisii]